MYIAIDPGATSGTCIVDSVKVSNNMLTFNVNACIAISWADRMYYADFVLLPARDIQAIIIESFKLTIDPAKLRSQAGSEMLSSRVIGLIESAAHLAGIQDRIVFQEPKDRFNVFVLAEHRTRVGLLKHNQDAYRHMHYYLRLKRNLITL